jgi:hypothetical protein
MNAEDPAENHSDQQISHEMTTLASTTIDLFTSQECANFFAAAGYGAT